MMMIQKDELKDKVLYVGSALGKKGIILLPVEDSIANTKKRKWDCSNQKMIKTKIGDPFIWNLKMDKPLIVKYAMKGIS